MEKINNDDFTRYLNNRIIRAKNLEVLSESLLNLQYNYELDDRQDRIITRLIYLIDEEIR
jgi:hypothetical protein